jgi:hypothetical protein
MAGQPLGTGDLEIKPDPSSIAEFPTPAPEEFPGLPRNDQHLSSDRNLLQNETRNPQGLIVFTPTFAGSKASNALPKSTQ